MNSISVKKNHELLNNTQETENMTIDSDVDERSSYDGEGEADGDNESASVKSVETNTIKDDNNSNSAASSNSGNSSSTNTNKAHSSISSPYMFSINNVNNNFNKNILNNGGTKPSSVITNGIISPMTCSNNSMIRTSHLCKDCFRTFKDINNYKEHRFQEHQEKYPNVRQCTMCSYATLLKSKYDCHMRCHLNNKVIKCQRCNYSTINIRHMSKHERMHMISNQMTNNTSSSSSSSSSLTSTTNKALTTQKSETLTSTTSTKPNLNQISNENNRNNSTSNQNLHQINYSSGIPSTTTTTQTTATNVNLKRKIDSNDTETNAKRVNLNNEQQQKTIDDSNKKYQHNNNNNNNNTPAQHLFNYLNLSQASATNDPKHFSHMLYQNIQNNFDNPAFDLNNNAINGATNANLLNLMFKATNRLNSFDECKENHYNSNQHSNNNNNMDTSSTATATTASSSPPTVIQPTSNGCNLNMNLFSPTTISNSAGFYNPYNTMPLLVPKTNKLGQQHDNYYSMFNNEHTRISSMDKIINEIKLNGNQELNKNDKNNMYPGKDDETQSLKNINNNTNNNLLAADLYKRFLANYTQFFTNNSQLASSSSSTTPPTIPNGANMQQTTKPSLLSLNANHHNNNTNNNSANQSSDNNNDESNENLVELKEKQNNRQIKQSNSINDKSQITNESINNGNKHTDNTSNQINNNNNQKNSYENVSENSTDTETEGQRCNNDEISSTRNKRLNLNDAINIKSKQYSYLKMENLFKCNMCGFKNKLKNNIINHLKLKHSQTNSKTNDEKKSENQLNSANKLVNQSPTTSIQHQQNFYNTQPTTTTPTPINPFCPTLFPTSLTDILRFQYPLLPQSYLYSLISTQQQQQQLQQQQQQQSTKLQDSKQQFQSNLYSNNCESSNNRINVNSNKPNDETVNSTAFGELANNVDTKPTLNINNNNKKSQSESQLNSTKLTNDNNESTNSNEKSCCEHKKELYMLRQNVFKMLQKNIPNVLLAFNLFNDPQSPQIDILFQSLLANAQIESTFTDNTYQQQQQQQQQQQSSLQITTS